MDIKNDSLDHFGEHRTISSSTPKREGTDEEAESPTRRRRMLPTRHGGSEKLYSQKDEDVIGHMRELRRRLSNEHELNEIDIKEIVAGSVEKYNDSSDWKNCDVPLENRNGIDEVVSRSAYIGEMEVLTGDGTSEELERMDVREYRDDRTPPSAEDQMSSTESEADGVLARVPVDVIGEQVSMEANNDQKQQLREMLDELATPYAQKAATSACDGVATNDVETQVCLRVKLVG